MGYDRGGMVEIWETRFHQTKVHRKESLSVHSLADSAFSLSF
jgi:hypothetical protein